MLLSAVLAHSQTLQKDALGVTVSAGEVITRVEIWSDRLIRVTHQPLRAAPLPQSLSVIAKPGKGKWSFSDTGEEVALSTPEVIVRVGKQTGRVRFLETKGSVILSEEENGSAFQVQTVGSAADTLASTQNFVLDPAEAIYGMGQHPEGVRVNNVGQSVKLLQENGKVAIPVMLSSKGVG